MVVIDYANAGSFKSNEWLLMEAKEQANHKRITKWIGMDGSTVEVKRGKLYIDGKQVYQWRGWGLSEGHTFYQFGRHKYAHRLCEMSMTMRDHLRNIMKKHAITDLTKQKRSRK